MKELICESSNDLSAIAEEVINTCKDLPVWVFRGEMGAGKTTLIKAIAAHFGIHDTVSSPSFSIVNEYQGEQGEVFYHFDFYRIKEQEEAIEIGVDEYFYSGKYCWVEWAEKIPDYLPEDFYLIDLSIEEGEKRRLEINKI